MPGKGNFGQFDRGQYCPGSSEWRAWDEGYVRRFVEGALSKTNTVHPVGTREFEADQSGWDRANNAQAGDRNMPYPAGAPT